MFNKKDALYRCLACGTEWTGARGPVECPTCGHEYVLWTNYPDLFEGGRAELGQQLNSPPDRPIRGATSVDPTERKPRH